MRVLVPTKEKNRQNFYRDNKATKFLGFFFNEDSPSRGKIALSAIAAGWGEANALRQGMDILRKLARRPFEESAYLAGLTKPYIALKLKEVTEPWTDEKGVVHEPESKELIGVAKIMLQILGEAVDEKKPGTINVQNAQIMVVQGYTPERLERLKAPQHETS